MYELPKETVRVDATTVSGNVVDLRIAGIPAGPSASKDAGDPTLKSTVLGRGVSSARGDKLLNVCSVFASFS